MVTNPVYKYRVPLGVSRETNLNISIVGNQAGTWFVCVEGKTFTAVDRTLPYYGTLKVVTEQLIKALEIDSYDND